MENVSERILLKHLQKEQERERRRIRDRQRRQSMTAEERERHLARRRRNYQLRRQRAEKARLELQLHQHATTSTTALPHHQQQQQQQQQQMMLPVPEVSNHVQLNGVAVESMQDSNFKAAYANHVALEVAARELAKLPNQPRIKHIKQLARSIAGPNDDSRRVAVEVVINANPGLSCMMENGLRLTRVKKLARSLRTDADEKDEDELQKKHNQSRLPQLEIIRQEED